MSWDHSFRTYAKFPGKLTFLAPWYAKVSVHIRGREMLVFRKILIPYTHEGKKNISLHIYLPLQKTPWVQQVISYILNNLPT